MEQPIWEKDVKTLPGHNGHCGSARWNMYRGDTEDTEPHGLQTETHKNKTQNDIKTYTKPIKILNNSIPATTGPNENPEEEENWTSRK